MNHACTLTSALDNVVIVQRSYLARLHLLNLGINAIVLHRTQGVRAYFPSLVSQKLVGGSRKLWFKRQESSVISHNAKVGSRELKVGDRESGVGSEVESWELRVDGGMLGVERLKTGSEVEGESRELWTFEVGSWESIRSERIYFQRVGSPFQQLPWWISQKEARCMHRRIWWQPHTIGRRQM